MQQAVKEQIENLCNQAGESRRFADDFFDRLAEDEEIWQEFVFYIQNGNFACRTKVCGYTIVDILVWQIDHFRATLDRDNSRTKQNGAGMVLFAFDTFMKMKQEPADYLEKLRGETGTDFVITG